MKRLCRLALAVAILAGATGRTPAGESVSTSSPELRDPEKVFGAAGERLKALEATHDLLKGVSEVKPAVERDNKGRLKSAILVFERNAVPPGKGPAKPKDASKPFVYVSIQVWSGRSQQPPADLHEFEWKGQTYQMWVRVFGSDADQVKAIRKALDEKSISPPHLSLCLQTPLPLQAYVKGQPLVFEGYAAFSIHRPGPEHFKLTRAADGQVLPLLVAYDRDKVERPSRGEKQSAAPASDIYAYNSLFKGTRLYLYGGAFHGKDPMGINGVLNLFGCPKLEAGVRYRLTWACWPVGSTEAVEVSREFELSK